MAGHERFNFGSLDALREKIADLGCDVPLNDDLSPLRAPVVIADKTAPNAIAILPMEGSDCEPDGSPSELARRRYLRYAAGGAGLLWWEACAVVPEGRANPRHMLLTEQNVGKFAQVLADSNQAAADANGAAHKPLHILQLTHAGRFSRDKGHTFTPVICRHDPALDARVGVGGDYPVATDAYLESMPGHFAKAARLAQQAGFDGVDIKACHRYLINELLACYARPGKYGGSFENRTRLLREIIAEVGRATSGGFIIASRLNMYDAHPYPYGWGVAHEDGSMRYDPAEPIRLVKLMAGDGVRLFGSSASSPYHAPHILRPFDIPVVDVPAPPEHPLEATARLLRFARDMQAAAGDIPVVGGGYSWLRQFAPHVGAASLAAGHCRFIGLGRLSFAYPDAPRDILAGGMEPRKVCVACSKCSQIMRDHGSTGCVVRDSEVYAPLYKQARQEAVQRAAAREKEATQ